ncbi:MAG: hypothetical protein ACXWQO_19315 [Bdellovibrionota bacterium]
MSALQELRARIGAMENFSRSESLPYSQFASGLPRGALVEISGQGKTESVVQFLAENAETPAAWIESEFSLYPPALFQRKRKLENTFFIEAGKDAPWAASTILRARLFPVIVYHAPYQKDERQLRRFQLLAEKAQATMILLARRKPLAAWPIALSLEVRERKLFVLRQK